MNVLNFIQTADSGGRTVERVGLKPL